jgi:hypothetical protein
MNAPNQADIDHLVSAARRACRKMKREYDRVQPDADPDECWAEVEQLADALEPFGVVPRQRVF